MLGSTSGTARALARLVFVDDAELKGRGRSWMHGGGGSRVRVGSGPRGWWRIDRFRTLRMTHEDEASPAESKNRIQAVMRDSSVKQLGDLVRPGVKMCSSIRRTSV